MTTNINELVNFAIMLANESGKIINKFFRSNISVTYKKDNTQVTNVDFEIERLFTKLIKNKFRNHQVIGEELSNKIEDKNSDIRWIIDPIDGTKAFIHGKPTFGTLIAAYKNNFPLLGIIDQPILGERWISFDNMTTFNGKKVKCSDKTDLNKAAMEATSPLMFSQNSFQKFMKVANEVDTIGWGSDCYAYGMMANGYIDIICEDNMKFWDFAALIPIIQGSGGIITDWEGKMLDENSKGKVLASANKEIHEKALKILNN